MKKLSIYNTYVEMQSQEQCDRMKQLCIDNGLSIWQDRISFDFFNSYNNCFYFYEDSDFAIYCHIPKNNNKITEQEFIELLKNQ